MNHKYFEKEVQKARQRFNQTFGRLTVCDLKLRQTALVGVSLLGLAQQRIQNRTGEALQTDICKFMRIRKGVECHFQSNRI